MASTSGSRRSWADSSGMRQLRHLVWASYLVRAGYLVRSGHLVRAD
jgi:hypothetical protein